MNSKRQIEIFSAGCSVCTEAIEMIKRTACPSCEVTILDMRDPDIARRAKTMTPAEVDYAQQRLEWLADEVWRVATGEATPPE